MTLVVDASALAGWLLPDETEMDLATLAATHAEFCAPWLLWAEFRHILIMSERRGRLPAGLVDHLVEAVEGLGIVLDTHPSNVNVIALARKHGLTVHDALYLDLAMRRQASLATLDAKLARAGQATGVPVIGG